MLRWRWLCLPLAAIAAGPAAAENTNALTLPRVIELAREGSPEARVAKARAKETRSGLVGAGVWSTENPSIDGAIGPRWAGDTSTDVEVSLSFPLDLSGERRKRVDVVEAEIARDDLAAEDAARQAAGAAVGAFYRMLYAEQRLALAEDWLVLAQELHRTAVEREKAGDVAQFSVNLAEGELGRASSAVAAEKSKVARARADLAKTLGIAKSGTLGIQGDLADRRLFDAVPASASGDDRPDVRAAGAELDVAGADFSLAGARRWPDVDLRITYAQEDDADILLGGLSITLPIFERGRGEQAKANARKQRAQVQLDAHVTTVGIEIDGAREAYRLAVEAVVILEKQALPKAIENEELAREAYRAGKLDLAALLLIRRDALETRREHLDRLLEAALAGVDLWVAVGAPSPVP